jgi:hypothetical protein
MIEHPFFSSIAGYNGRIAIEGYLGKQIMILEDHISRCNELAEQTNVLISLIFNIATLQDTRAAIEESKAANVLAASIRRVTMLTFVYLPLTLAAVSMTDPLFASSWLMSTEYSRNERYGDLRRNNQPSAMGLFRHLHIAHGSNFWRLVRLVAYVEWERSAEWEMGGLVTNSVKLLTPASTIFSI